MPQSLPLFFLQLIYAISAFGLAAYGLQAFILTLLRLRADRLTAADSAKASGDRGGSSGDGKTDWPSVTVQLPVYNELHVVGRLIDACARIDYPADRLQIQVLDDSDDDTIYSAKSRAAYWRRKGTDVQVVRRSIRRGYKAGALQEGLASAAGEFIAVFDADFAPRPGFLRSTIPVFLAPSGAGVGFVQTRWAHLNPAYSALTRAQALALDGHFVVEQAARHSTGLPFGFNGSAGAYGAAPASKTPRSAAGRPIRSARTWT